VHPAECTRNQEELIERILHAGLTYSDVVGPETSLVVCNEPRSERGNADLAREFGVPVVSDAQFMAYVGAVVGGTGAKEFTDVTAVGGPQFALF
jgi:DNA polymerase-3 subunit epsilon